MGNHCETQSTYMADMQNEFSNKPVLGYSL